MSEPHTLHTLHNLLPEIDTSSMETFDVKKGMATSVWESKYSRLKDDGKFQSWSERLKEVVDGNFVLSPDSFDEQDYKRTLELAIKGVMPTSGRHIQHGDIYQPQKAGEVFSNCSTAMFSFIKFLLLLKGSGVGRDYSSDLCFVNWDNLPEVRLVLDAPEWDSETQSMKGGHPDYEPWIETLREARHKYSSDSERTRWFDVEDSAEGWVKVISILETACFHGHNKESIFIFNFSNVRGRGKPIRGAQGRPSSGPVPFMEAITKLLTIKGAGMPLWQQAMFVDHFLSMCVAIGGIRRAARIACKYWKDKDVIDFIDIKRGGFLHTANNSVLVDEEFWRQAASPKPSHARRVFEAICAASYFDKTGEPGIINVDRLTTNNANRESINEQTYMHAGWRDKLSIHKRTDEMISYYLSRIKTRKYNMICNPCVTADTWVDTSKGLRQVSDLINNKWKLGDELSQTYIVNGRKVKGSPFFKTGYKKVYQLNTKEGHSLKLTSNHKVMVETGRKCKARGGYTVETSWVEAKDLEPGDKIMLNNQRNYMQAKVPNDLKEAEGYALGVLVGDGTFDLSRAVISLWDNKQDCANKISAFLASAGEEDYTFEVVDDIQTIASGGSVVSNVWTSKNEGRVLLKGSKFLKEVAASYGIERGNKTLTPTLMRAKRSVLKGFIAGVFDTDGTIATNKDKGASIRLSNTDLSLLENLQIVLLRFGINSTIYKERKEEGVTLLPNGKGGNSEYNTKAYHELHIAKDNMQRFADMFDLVNPTHTEKLEELFASYGNRGPYAEKFLCTFESLDYVGREDVYDVVVPDVNAFSANGIYAHNCGEITLSSYGAYCVIGDVCLERVTDLQEARDAVSSMARFLIRVNTMPMLYDAEVKRTNRIGVSLTGIHEFAYTHFGVLWYEHEKYYDYLEMKAKCNGKGLPEDYELPSDNVMKFWKFMDELRLETERSAELYSKELGLNTPHTSTTIKPSGTISKVMGCTEGAHLPASGTYVRWNQFSKNDPTGEIEKHRALGYPIIDLEGKGSYKDCVIIGFPTKQPIVDIMGADNVVTASQATLDSQYKWLCLLERFWLGGEGVGNQVSYTLKYKPNEVDYDRYKEIMLNWQAKVKCCSIMPEVDASAFAYLPEQPVPYAEYEKYMSNITDGELQSVHDEDQLACEGGVCPIEPSINGKYDIAASVGNVLNTTSFSAD